MYLQRVKHVRHGQGQTSGLILVVQKDLMLYHVSRKCPVGFFYNLKHYLNRSSKFLAHNITKIIASKCMHNFPPHLSYVATLPEKIISCRIR